MDLSNSLFSETEAAARLRLSAEEKNVLQEWLKFVDQIQLSEELFACCSPATQTEAVLRPDRCKPSLEHEVLLQNTSETDGFFFSVPCTLE